MLRANSKIGGGGKGNYRCIVGPTPFKWYECLVTLVFRIYNGQVTPRKLRKLPGPLAERKCPVRTDDVPGLAVRVAP